MRRTLFLYCIVNLILPANEVLSRGFKEDIYLILFCIKKVEEMNGKRVYFFILFLVLTRKIRQL